MCCLCIYVCIHMIDMKFDQLRNKLKEKFYFLI